MNCMNELRDPSDAGLRYLESMQKKLRWCAPNMDVADSRKLLTKEIHALSHNVERLRPLVSLAMRVSRVAIVEISSTRCCTKERTSARTLAVCGSPTMPH